ncbi:UNKNOWN [Stylonychia lemnae]|uniref:Uncharacterized protein n=1 Tax=Stylonychia lemnae TaxID=5949 RepID=A0A077ZW15_STYLE|nr:UNKNOWN [Stylonychia lemnae]|eukprot:CDW73450.1 UNKNOWN [Stylonychia lemnae]
MLNLVDLQTQFLKGDDDNNNNKIRGNTRQSDILAESVDPIHNNLEIQKKSSQQRLLETNRKHGVIQEIIKQLNAENDGSTSPIFKIDENIFETFFGNDNSVQNNGEEPKLDKLQVSYDDSVGNIIKQKLFDSKREESRVPNTTPSTPVKQLNSISFNMFQNALLTEQKSTSNRSSKNNLPLYLRPQAIQQVANKITFKEAMNILKIARVDRQKGEKELMKVIQSKSPVVEEKPKPTPHEQMDEIIKGMQRRDCFGNILRYHEEMNQLQKQKNITTNARLSHCQLTNIRKLIPKEYIRSSQDFDRINVTMLNEYLNKYSEKLSRGNAQDPYEIKVDFDKYDEILSGIESQTYNPFFMHIEVEAEKKNLDSAGNILSNKKIVPSRYLDQANQSQANFKLKNPIAAKQQEVREKLEIFTEIQEIKTRFQPQTTKFKRLYMKSIDINQFENYQGMLKSLRKRQIGQSETLNKTMNYDNTSFFPRFGSNIGGKGERTAQTAGLIQGNESYGLDRAVISTGTHTRIMSPLQSNVDTKKFFSSIKKHELIKKIGEIWKSSQRMRKENFRFQKRQEKRLNVLSQEISHLNTFANQSLNQAKKEFEKIKFEKEKIRLKV